MSAAPSASEPLDHASLRATEAADRALGLAGELRRLLAASDRPGAVELALELGRRGAELRPLLALLDRPEASRRLEALDAHAENLVVAATRAGGCLARGDLAGALDRVDLEAIPMADGLATRARRERSLILGPAAVVAEREAMIRRLRALPDLPDAPSEFEATVAVCAYNKLEVTRLCVEFLLRHTPLDPGRVELLLVDHGSSDGTREFFRSIPNARVIELDRNTGPLGGWSAAYVAMRGEVLLTLSNDVLATPRWMENLLACVRSDRRIALVTPVSNSVSNRQAVPVDYGDDLAAMERFADRFNRSDPRRWEDRCRLMPFAAAAPRRLYQSGFRPDPLYTQGEFVDDDQSTTFRRAGLRQVLAGDTFLHHFGSLTLGAAQRLERSLENMRTEYRRKWGVDAWDGAVVHTEVATVAGRLSTPAGASILAVDPMFGETLLHLRWALEGQGLPPGPADALVRDSRYLDDARPMVRQVWEGGFDRVEGRYDLVVFCQELGEAAGTDPVGVLLQAAGRLAPGGRIFARVSHARSVPTLLRLLRPNLGQQAHDARAVVPLISLPRVCETLAGRGLRTRTIPLAEGRADDASRVLAELLAKLNPDTGGSLDPWLTFAHLLVVERAS